MQADRRHGRYTNAALRTETLQALHIPAAIFAEPVIVADDNMTNAEPLMQDDLDKLCVVHLT